MTDPIPSFASLILAAGISSRMGSPKALLPIYQQTLLAYQIEQLRPFSQIIYVVIGAAYQEIQAAHRSLPDAIQWVINPDYTKGMSSSVRAGIQSLMKVRRVKKIRPSSFVTRTSEGVFITPVDHLTHRSVLTKMVAVFQKEKPLLLSPLMNGRKGHPLLVHADLLPELLNIEEETQGMRAVIQKYKEYHAVVPVNWLGATFDLDTPEDYQKMLDYLGEGQTHGFVS